MCNGSFESKAPRAPQLTQPLLKGQKRRCRVVLCSWWQWFLGDYECRHNEDIAFVNLLHISNNSILLISGLNPAWHFWLTTPFSCCLKMKSVENILGYIHCKPLENTWKCSRKYPKMLKTDSFLGNKKLSFNQNVWRDHATMQQDVLLHFWVIFLYWNPTEIWKKYSVVQI